MRKTERAGGFLYEIWRFQNLFMAGGELQGQWVQWDLGIHVQLCFHRKHIILSCVTCLFGTNGNFGDLSPIPPLGTTTAKGSHHRDQSEPWIPGGSESTM